MKCKWQLQMIHDLLPKNKNTGTTKFMVGTLYKYHSITKILNDN